MTNIRSWINLVENIDKEREFYINQANEFRKERAKGWPVSKELLASYKDGSHTRKYSDGTLAWLKNGRYHRDGNKPAYIGTDDTLQWYKNGHWQRDGDKPARISADGSLEWWKNGHLHRDGDKPARIEATGSLQWWKNYLLHRLLGPAVITENNDFEWWFKGEEIPVNSQEEFLQWLQKNGHIDVYRLRKQ
jgi:hypothetical protein